MSVIEHKHEVISRHNGALSRDTKYYSEDEDDMRKGPLTILARVIYFITSLAVVILLLRFLLSMLGANRGNAFADFIYSASHPLAAPFFGLFNYQAQYGVSRFEFETLIAALVYVLIGWAIVALIGIGRGTDTEV